MAKQWKIPGAAAVFPLPLLVLLAAYVAVSSLFWTIHPIWDGMLYYEQALKSVFRRPVNDHISQGYFLMTSIPLSLVGRNYVLFNVWLTLFSACGVVAFYHLADMATRGRLAAWEVALYAAIYAFHPTIMANMMRTNLDAGLTVFLLLYWAALWREKRKLALLFALLAIFTKEISFLLLPVPFLFCLLLQPRQMRRSWFWKEVPFLLIPYAAVACMIFYRVVIHHHSALWHGNGIASSVVRLLPTFKSSFTSYLVLIGMNFQWLVFGLWAVLLAVALLRRQKTNLSIAMALLLVLLATVYTVTRVVPFLNLRYVMVTAPALLLCFFSVLPLAVFSPVRRMALCTALLALLAVQDTQSLDPLPVAYFGTFDFGDHKMLNFHPHETQVLYGRDELVYNLQYLKFAEAEEAIIRDIRPAEDTAFVLPPDAAWYMWPGFDRKNYTPTFEEEGIRPNIMGVSEVKKLQALPAHLYAVSFANCRCDDYFTPLDPLYLHKSQKIYDQDGYKTVVYEYSDVAPAQTMSKP